MRKSRRYAKMGTMPGARVAGEHGQQPAAEPDDPAKSLNFTIDQSHVLIERSRSQ